VSVAVIAVIAVLLVLGVGYLIFVLMRKSQAVVPEVADRDDAKHDLVVGTDEQGRAIHASEDLQEPARDVASFDSLLKDEIREQGREEPVADDES
jgi:hypothetical protein